MIEAVKLPAPNRPVNERRLPDNIEDIKPDAGKAYRVEPRVARAITGYGRRNGWKMVSAKDPQRDGMILVWRVA